MLDKRDLAMIQEIVATITQANIAAVESECDGLAGMFITAFGRMETRLDDMLLHIEAIEELIKDPHREPIQRFLLDRQRYRP